MRGRKPHAPQLHVIRGNPNHRPPSEIEYTAVEDESFPPPPAHLNEDGREIWETMGRELTRCGVVQVVDLYALQQMAYMWQRHLAKARQDIDPISAEMIALKSIFSEFGMTPASRRRFGKDDGDAGKQTNRFKKFRQG
jgi:phage terminase small subunit